MTSQASYCQNCGAALNSGATFCAHCGNPIRQVGQTPSAPNNAPPLSPTTYQTPPPSPYMPVHMQQAGNLGLGLIVGVLLAVTIGLIPILGLFIAGLIAGLIARGVGRGALAGVVAGVAHWLLVAVVLSTIGLNFMRLDRLFAYGGVILGLALVILLIFDLIVGVIAGLIGGAIHPQRY